jgi:cell division protein FtsL
MNIMDTLSLLCGAIGAETVSSKTLVQESMTNSYDAVVVFFICIAVVASILIITIAAGIVLWRYNRLSDLKDRVTKLENELSQKVDKRELDKSVNELNSKAKSEQACEILERISSIVKPKDGIVDGQALDSLYSTYKKILSDVNE